MAESIERDSLRRPVVPCRRSSASSATGDCFRLVSPTIMARRPTRIATTNTIRWSSADNFISLPRV
jgi:hypothetical protein